MEDLVRWVEENRDRHFSELVEFLRIPSISSSSAHRTEVARDRGQQRPALRVRQDDGGAAAHRGDERIGGAQVDAYRKAMLVRRRRLAGLGDLQQGHYSSPS